MGMFAGESSSLSYSGKLKKVVKKILVQTCGSFRCGYQNPPSDEPDNNNNNNNNTSEFPYPVNNLELLNHTSVIKPSRLDSTTNTPSNKNFCPICLDSLSYSCDSSPGQAIFTAQCSHAFHFACISSNIRHGNVTCPVCRAHWTQLPRTLKMHYSPHSNQADPILQILDESIATSRVHRRSFLRSARYDDDDPVEPDRTSNIHRLHLSLSPAPHSTSVFDPCSNPKSSFSSCHYPQHCLESSQSAAQHFVETGQSPLVCSSSSSAFLCLKLAHQPATDLVLVASPNGPHLRLMKQAMAFVVFSLRPIDRLAIVTYSSAAARIFPLKCMTSYGKRTALQVIDRLFYMGQADPVEGLKKGVKILRERSHQNTHSFILHLSDNPTRSFHGFQLELPITIHKFHVGFGFGTSNGFVMHEFERFLVKILCGAVRDIALMIGEDTRIVRLGELRGGEERRIPLLLEELDKVRVVYTYIDCMMDDSVKTGEVVVGVGDRKELTDTIDIVENTGGRSSSVEGWEYHDPFMARRWAKRLHGYRI
ncbi:probable E3 ubiquitin-protein ligase EDA40 [Solanum stenotomum]|uniref:probable E3 ubiquitin-protein ligase EDA40 n=1 Tax=Solanum stenotomum TaxID=172797 RepID=UPI0020D008C7|nr:probable E3 ubiquitin-protein ligase EDA40 [Solanum stenotomum]